MRIVYWFLCSLFTTSSYLIHFASIFLVRLLLRSVTDVIGKLLGLLSLISMVFFVLIILILGCLMVEMGVFGSLMKQSLEKGNLSLLMLKKYSKCFCRQNMATPA